MGPSNATPRVEKGSGWGISWMQLTCASVYCSSVCVCRVHQQTRYWACINKLAHLLHAPYKKMIKIQLNPINDILPSYYTNRIPVAFWLKKGLNFMAFRCPWRGEGGFCYLTTVGALSASWAKIVHRKFKWKSSCFVRHLPCGFLLKRTNIPWTLSHNRFRYELGICRPNT